MNDSTSKIIPLPQNDFDFTEDSHTAPCPEIGSHDDIQPPPKGRHPRPVSRANANRLYAYFNKHKFQQSFKLSPNNQDPTDGPSIQGRNLETIAASQKEQFQFNIDNNYVSFHGHEFYIDGDTRYLLEKLDESRYPVMANVLQGEWRDREDISRDNLKNRAKILRKKLRTEFNLSDRKDDNPVQSSGRGRDLSYGLNYEALLKGLISKNNK
ncbi:hypothetical protein Mal35_17050 [Gimesia maris]|uniref:hypothetical protein n=1 Tax=Gimesia maris TaxID=122 RepID=UPI00118AD3DF|nr:hypothetical protein [Gimesia maris]QDT78273.1 hypothetical protein Mal35_17050 [Gimesia maris]